jgi:hypothetical protein
MCITVTTTVQMEGESNLNTVTAAREASSVAMNVLNLANTLAPEM